MSINYGIQEDLKTLHKSAADELISAMEPTITWYVSVVAFHQSKRQSVIMVQKVKNHVQIMYNTRNKYNQET